MSRKVIVDLEMTGLSMKDKMVSLAALDIESGKLFYAESTEWSDKDININNVNWMKENVIDQLLFDSDIKLKLCRRLLDQKDILNIFPQLNKIDIKDSKCCIHIHDTLLTDIVLGSNKNICTKFSKWLEGLLIDEKVEYLSPETKTYDDDIIFLMDVGHYDFVFLCELFGGAFNLPQYIQPIYHDINYYIANMNKCKLQEAFNLSRELLAMNKYPDYYKTIGNYYPLFANSHQHNAANDVIVSSIILA